MNSLCDFELAYVGLWYLSCARHGLGQSVAERNLDFEFGEHGTSCTVQPGYTAQLNRPFASPS